MNLSLKTIAEHDFFLGLENETINKLTQNAILKKYHHGEIIAHQGDIWPNLFLVLEGEIKAKMESIEGRAFVAATIHPGDIFWGLAFFIATTSGTHLLTRPGNSF